MFGALSDSKVGGTPVALDDRLAIDETNILGNARELKDDIWGADLDDTTPLDCNTIFPNRMISP